MKNSNIPTLIFSVIFCLLVVSIVIYPNEAFTSAKDGLMLWLNIVCPSLLPFFICVEIMIGLGIVSFFGASFRPLFRPVFKVPGEGSFNFFMSIASGYPVGSRITAKLRQEKLCTQLEGQRLLSLCSTSGPLFIIGAVATGIMNNPALGLLLASAHYLSAVTVGFLMRFYGNEKSYGGGRLYSNPIAEMLGYRKKDGRPIGLLIGDAVKNGINLILMIGGFIILFSVITRMLKISGILSFLALVLSKAVPFEAFTPDIASSLLIGFLEVTNGVKECAAMQVPLIHKVVMTSFMIGFGGLSVNAQVMSIISETDLRFDIYFLFKLLQGFAAAVYSYIILSCLSELQVFNTYDPAQAYTVGGWQHALINSSVYLLLVLTFMLIVSAPGIKKRLMLLKPFR
ncbi:MAG TPA: sporulation integral membrane protein YlbJ [Clostridia bacterium]|nr:sporulation integral membrane protein YlbJ [Clostridia bacterium]